MKEAKKHLCGIVLYLVLMLVFLAPVACMAAMYYISTTGVDSPTGGTTPETAWASIDYGDSQGLLQPGDIVIVLPGTYSPTTSYNVTAGGLNWNCCAVLQNCSGTTGDPIIYHAYGDVYFSVPDQVWNSSCILMVQSSNLRIEGIKFTDACYAVVLAGSGCEITNCTMGPTHTNDPQHNPGVYGALYAVNGTTSANVHHNVMAGFQVIQVDPNGSGSFCNNVIDGPYGLDIKSSSSSFTVKNNIFVEGGPWGGAAALRFGMGGGSVTVDHTNNTFYNCGYITNYNGTLTTAPDGTAENTLNPSFVNEASGDYRLQYGSPMIDTGVYIGYYYNGSTPDRGCYEAGSVILDEFYNNDGWTLGYHGYLYGSAGIENGYMHIGHDPEPITTYHGIWMSKDHLVTFAPNTWIHFRLKEQEVLLGADTYADFYVDGQNIADFGYNGEQHWVQNAYCVAKTWDNEWFIGSPVMVGEVDGFPNKNIDIRLALSSALANKVKYSDFHIFSVKYEVIGTERRMRFFVDGRETGYRDLDCVYPSGNLDNHVISNWQPATGVDNVLNIKFSSLTDGNYYADTSVNGGWGIRREHAFTDYCPAIPHLTTPSLSTKKTSDMYWDYLIVDSPDNVDQIRYQIRQLLYDGRMTPSAAVFLELLPWQEAEDWTQWMAQDEINEIRAHPLGSSDFGNSHGHIIGIVSWNGTPLKGAVVQVLNTSVQTTTIWDHTYNVRLAPGTYTIQVSYPGAEPGQATVTVTNGQTVFQNFSLGNDITAPTPGTCTPPAGVTTSTITIPYSGASDSSSGLHHVELWYKKESGGTWTNSGLTSATGSGQFVFTPSNGSGTYYFDLVAQDNMGNRSASAWGNGDGSTSFKQLWYDGFSSGDFTTGSWTNSGCDMETYYVFGFGYSSGFNSSDSLIKSFSTIGKTNIRVRYVRRTVDCTSSCHFISEWYNGSAWTTLEDVTGDSTWAWGDYALPSGANNNANFKIRFRTSGYGSTNHAYVDEVTIMGL